MKITEIIRERKSVRSYLNTPLRNEEAANIEKFIAGLTPPFGAKARIELIRDADSANTEKLGTYGVVKGARDFLVLAYEDAPMAEEGAAYALEQVILYCTGLGLGTCWIGGTLKHSDFAAAIGLQPEETLRIISPVGHRAGKKTFVDAAFSAAIGSRSRMPIEKLFFDGSWDKPLLQETAGKFAVPLEMVRLAPSARNKQPWRMLVDGDAVHFYRRPDDSRFTRTDIGIALCHFEQACAETGIGGRYIVSNDHPAPPADAVYVISYIAG